MKRVLLVGSLAYDQIFRFRGNFADNLNLAGISSSYFCDKYSLNFGGTAGNIAYGLSILGEVDLTICSVLGSKDADDYLERIKNMGFVTDYISVVKGTKSATACICTDTKEQQLTFFYPGPNENEFKVDFKELNSEFACISATYASLMAHALDYCIKKNIPYVFDPGQQVEQICKNSNILKYLENATYLTLNSSEYDYIVKNLGAKSLERRIKNLVVTNGEKPTKVYENFGLNVYEVPVDPVAAADPTGAGDAFRAALIYGIMVKGINLNDSILFASCFALKCINTYGTQNYT